jgi:hypothetical protein
MQNNAIRLIFNQSWTSSTDDLLKTSGMPPLKERISNLTITYLSKAITNGNPFITKHCQDFIETKELFEKIPTILCEHTTELMKKMEENLESSRSTFPCPQENNEAGF